MSNIFLYPDGWTFLVVKVCIFMLAVLVWLIFSSAPAI